MPSASLSGTSGCGHKRWLRVRVPAVAVLGCSLFWFLFLVWAPMHLDCRVRHGGGGGGGSGGSASGNGEEERAREDAAWVVATGALDESVVMAVVQPQGGGTSGGASGRSFKRRRRRRRKVLAVLGLHTGFDALQRRKSLRETWVPSTPQGTARQREATGLLIKFVIGRTPDPAKMATVGDEAEVFKDFIFLDVEESAHMGVTKSLAFFKAAYELYDADFYVKADDNFTSTESF